MRKGVQDFVSSLLDHARTSTELEVMLNFNHEATTEIWMPNERQTLDRLKLAIKYKQKNVISFIYVLDIINLMFDITVCSSSECTTIVSSNLVRWIAGIPEENWNATNCPSC